MLRAGRFTLLFVLLSLVHLANAQGSAAGYGQAGGGGRGGGAASFGGGGLGGRSGLPPSSKDEPAVAKKPDDDEEGLWDTKTAVLTPGDRVEYKFKLKKGETVMASATSDAFDPALSIEDANKKELAKNDDRQEGDQSPFLIYRVTDAGTYTLKVLSYRSVSGGKFTAKFRTFLAADAPQGEARITLPGSEETSHSRMVFRLSAKKDKTYDLRNVFGIVTYGMTGTNIIHIVGPSGVAAEDYQVISTNDNTPVFLAKKDGDYYAEYYRPGGITECRTDYREVTVMTAKASDEQSFDLDRGELKIIQFPVQPDEIVRTTLTGSDFWQLLDAPASDVRDFSGPEDPAYGTNRSMTWFMINRDSDKDIVRIFHGTGTARLAIRSTSGKAEKVTFKNSDSIPDWMTGDSLKGGLEIGDSKLFLVKSTKSELMRVAASATHFEPKLEIFQLDGGLANTLMDRKTHQAKDDLYFPDAGTFVVRLSCDGYGGSGDYNMKREALSPIPYTLGTATTLTLDGANFGLFSVNLEAGKRYELMTDEPESYLRADLLDDDGQFLTSRGLSFDKVMVQYFTPTRSGRHRLWLRGQPGTRHFKFSLHVPPSIGG